MFDAKQSNLTSARRAHIRRTLWLLLVSDERDEYHQSLTLRRIAIATNATMGTAIVWGFLQAFGVMPLVEAYWIPLIWVVMQGASGCIAVVTRGRAAV